MNNTHSSPITLYKYRDWSNELHKKILTQNELFMAPPSSFNDPFDCMIPKNYFLLDTDEKVNQLMEKIELKNQEKLTLLDFDSKKKLNGDFKKRFNDLNSVQKNHESLLFKQTSECYGIISFSTKWDSLLMWSHYSNNHKGFSVGFNEEKIRNSGLFGSGINIQYSNDFPIRNPLEDMHPMEDAMLQLGYKSKEWSYEKEYRLINLNADGIPKSERIIKLPDDFISEIVLGIEITEKDKFEILEIARLKKIKVYQLSKEPFKFKLLRTEIKNYA